MTKAICKTCEYIVSILKMDLDTLKTTPPLNHKALPEYIETLLRWIEEADE